MVSHNSTVTKVLFLVATSLAVTSLVLLLVWYLQFRGGFTYWYDVEHLKQLFSWHPLLITIGLVLINGEAMLLFRIMERRAWTKWLHAVLQALGFILTVLGCHVVVVRRDLNNPPKAHLYNIHGWFGILAVFLFACQLFVGGVMFLLPQMANRWKSVYLKVHVVFGPAILVLASCSAIIGMYDIGKKIVDYDKFAAEGLLANFTASSLMLFTALTVYLVLHPHHKAANNQ